MLTISQKEFYNHFVSQGYACMLIEKIRTLDKGTWMEGTLYTPGIPSDCSKLQIYDRQERIIEFKNEQRTTCDIGNVPLYFSTSEERFVNLSDESIVFERTLFETDYPCRKGSVFLYDVVLSNIFVGCVLVIKNWA